MNQHDRAPIRLRVGWIRAAGEQEDWGDPDDDVMGLCADADTLLAELGRVEAERDEARADCYEELLREALARFVMALAGYEATPAEEMPREGEGNDAD